MRLVRCEDAPAWAAAFVAEAVRDAVARRGAACLAVSGGRTPAPMFRALAGLDVPWDRVHLLQVDERMAPRDHPDRNLTGLTADLLDRVPIPTDRVHPAPVGGGDVDDADAVAERYARTLAAVCGLRGGGRFPVLDLVHLGLGADGHTASLVPGDPVADVRDRAVAATGLYRGRRRITLTRPVLDAARLRLWLVTGAEKAPALARLVYGDGAIPAGRLRRDAAVVVVDAAAFAGLSDAALPADVSLESVQGDALRRESPPAASENPNAP